MKALIDDMVLYKAACSGTSKKWSVVHGDNIMEVESYRDGLKVVKGLPGSELVSEDVDRGFQACLFALKQLLGRILKDTGSTDYVFVLSNRDTRCFRHKVATLKPYKGNRAPRPLYYDQTYDALMRRHPHVIARPGLEVDDELGIMQDTRTTIICSSDKDLRQIPGHHYNLDSREKFFVTQEGSLSLNNKRDLVGTGQPWVLAQMILGDTADNIPGISSKHIPGIGRKVSERVCTGIKADGMDFVVQCFKNQYGDNYMKAMQEVFTLVKILQKDSEIK